MIVTCYNPDEGSIKINMTIVNNINIDTQEKADDERSRGGGQLP